MFVNDNEAYWSKRPDPVNRINTAYRSRDFEPVIYAKSRQNDLEKYPTALVITLVTADSEGTKCNESYICEEMI